MFNALLQFAVTPCPEHPFFGLPVWYHYLNAAGKMDFQNGQCNFISLQNGLQVQDLSLIALAAVDIALRIAGILAVGYVVYGGIQYITSQGEPDQSKHARQTIINALIGLMIAMIATGIVSFVGARLGD